MKFPMSFTALMCMLLAAFAAQATTRVELGFDELVAGSELIFIGTVESVEQAVEGELVYSRVRFAVEDGLVGIDTGASLELRFLGGSSGELSTEVEGQYIPAAGAYGLWFVEHPDRELVNPLTGWSQGYFPIVREDDGTAWLDLRLHPDYAVLQPIDPLAAKMRSFNFSEARIDERFPIERLYPVDDFVDAIAAIVAAQGR